jgi:hypothetical protein
MDLILIPLYHIKTVIQFLVNGYFVSCCSHYPGRFQNSYVAGTNFREYIPFKCKNKTPMPLLFSPPPCSNLLDLSIFHANLQFSIRTFSQQSGFLVAWRLHSESKRREDPQKDEKQDLCERIEGAGAADHVRRSRWGLV